MKLPKKYKPAEVEQKWQRHWEERGIYKFDKFPDRPIYSIDTPPPTVSGKIHVGHVFSYVQAEVVARYWRMRGHNVYYPFGFDDNGLPSERLVEQEKGVKAMVAASTMKKTNASRAARYDRFRNRRRI